MSKNVAAWTAPGAECPEFVNFTQDGDEVIVTVRAPATRREGAYVCAHARDAGPGRCVPGGPTCNNYCNMAPQKGPMADHPFRCTHVDCGATVSMRLPKAEFDRMIGEIR